MPNPKAKFEVTAEDKASRALRAINAEVKGMGRAVKALGGAFVGFGLVSFGREVISVNRSFDVLRATLETVTGSAEAAEVAFSRIKEFAAETPYDVEQATESFIKLKAMGLDPSIKSLQSYGNTASAMGKDLNMMIEAVADAATGEFERLKEFGIKARSQGDQVTFTFRGVSKTIQKEAGAIEDYLRQIGESDFAGAMEKRAKTLDGAISNLGDSWTNLMDAMLDTEGAKTAMMAIRGVSQIIDELTGKLEQTEVPFKDEIRELEGELSKLESVASRYKGSGLLHRWLYGEEGEVNAKIVATKTELEHLRKTQKEFVEFHAEQDKLKEERAKAREEREKRERVARQRQERDLAKLNKLMEEGKKITESVITPQEKYIAQTMRLNVLREKGAITAETYGRAVIKYGDELVSATDKVKDQEDAFKDLKTAVEGWGQSFADELLSGEMNFKNFASSMVKQLARIAITKSVNPFFEQAGNWLSSSLGDLFSGLGFADGGRPPVGQASIVGERGPELFVPDTTGTIIPNHALGGGGVVINQNIQVDAPGATQDIVARIEDAVSRGAQMGYELVANDISTRGPIRRAL